MDYIRNRKSNIPFSLHDSRIIQIETVKDTLSFRVDRVFQYTDYEENGFPE